MALFPNPENVNDLMTNDINDLQDDVVIGNYPTIPYVRYTAGGRSG